MPATRKTNRKLPLKRAGRDLTVSVPLHERSGASRFFSKMVRDIEVDLAGRRNLSRIESELIRCFCGSATMLQYQNVQIALGETSEIDIAGYSNLASTMLRIGSKLGLSRRSITVTDPLEQYLAEEAAKTIEAEEVSHDHD